MPVMESKFSKINHKFFQTGGRAPGAPALDPPLDQMIFTRITHIYIYIHIQDDLLGWKDL